VIWLHFYDRDGNPLPGRAPTSLHVVGVKPSGDQAAAMQREFNKFCNMHRVGLFQSRNVTIRIDPLCELDLAVNHGVFSAIARVEPDEGGSNFYGGIVVQLQRVLDDEYWEDAHFDRGGDSERGTELYPLDENRELLPDIGPTDDDVKAVRPDVPGPLGDAGGQPTDTLIFQIPATGDVTRRDLVKIYRICSPWVGAIAAHAIFPNPRRYIISALVDIDANVVGFTLCGQLLPLALPTFYLGPSDSLFAHGFQPATFEAPTTASGVLVAAANNQLWAYDCASLSPSWLLVAEVPEVIGVQPFGLEFAVTAHSDGDLTVECSGSNADGLCSSYIVTFTRSIINPTTVSGALTLRAQPAIAPLDLPVTFSQAVSWQNAVQATGWSITTYTAIDPLDTSLGYTSVTDPGTDYILTTAWSCSAAEVSYTGGTDPVRDEFVGGFLNPRGLVTTFTLSSVVDAESPEPLEREIIHTGVPFGAVSYLQGNEKWFMARYAGSGGWANYASGSITDNLSMRVEGGEFGAATYDHTIVTTANRSATPRVIDAGVETDPGTLTEGSTHTTSYSMTTGGAINSDRNYRHYYTSIDLHTRLLAIRTDFTRTGSWSHDGESPLGDTEIDAASFRLDVVDRNGSVIVDGGDFLTWWPSVGGAGAFSGVFNPFLQLDAGVYPDNGNRFDVAFEPPDDPAAMIGYFSYLKWFGLDLPLSSTGHRRDASPSVAGYYWEYGPAPTPPTPGPLDSFVGSFSANVSYANTQVPYDLASYRALGDFDDILDGTRWGAAGDLERFHGLNFSIFGIPGPGNPLPGDRYRATLQPPDCLEVMDKIYVDPRTGGYIAQVFWEASGTDEIVRPRHILIIGNQDGWAPLTDVLNAWIARTGHGETYEKIFLRRETTQHTSLI
jgi:hypothetical protein